MPRDEVHFVHQRRDFVHLLSLFKQCADQLVLGDHQPPRGGAATQSESGYDVPIHVFANRDWLLAPFRAQGFVDGLVPDAEFEAFS